MMNDAYLFKYSLCRQPAGLTLKTVENQIILTQQWTTKQIVKKKRINIIKYYSFNYLK